MHNCFYDSFDDKEANMEKIWGKNTTALDGVICVQCKLWGSVGSRFEGTTCEKAAAACIQKQN